MIYEVYLPGYGTMMKTTSVRAVDDMETIEMLAKNGHKFKVDGKVVAKSNVHQAVADSLDITVAEVRHQIKEQEKFSEEFNDEARKRFIEERVIAITQKPKEEPAPAPKRKVTRIRCVELDTVYKNMTEAGKSLGIDPAYISDAVRLNKPTKGYHFERLED